MQFCRYYSSVLALLDIFNKEDFIMRHRCLTIWVVVFLFVVSVSSRPASAGYIKAWGYNGSGQCDVPAGEFIAIAAGNENSFALKTDPSAPPGAGGSLVAWGYNWYGQCDVPAGSDYIAIAAGYWHSLALKADGSLAAWGYNGYGQCDVPAGTDYITIAAGECHSLALKADGSLTAWGANYHGQCSDIPGGAYEIDDVWYSNSNDFTGVAAGYDHSLALKADPSTPPGAGGSLAAWGYNYWGQCDVPAGSDYIDIAGGGGHSLALKADGSLAAWGSNSDGQCDVPAGSDYIDIAAGCFHGLALKADGSLAAWGWNGFGQCDVPAGEFIAIAAGGHHSLALTPEPATVLLLGFGGLFLRRRR